MAKKKKIVGYVKLQAPAGSATPSPPIGPALGQRGLNIMEFCKAFNAETESMEKGAPVPVTITVFHDKSFSFVIKTPPVSYLLCKAAGVAKGSATPGRVQGGVLTAEKVREIAEIKLPDLNTDDVGAAVRTVEGAVRSLGFSVQG